MKITRDNVSGDIEANLEGFIDKTEEELEIYIDDVYGNTPWNGMNTSNLSAESIEENLLAMSPEDLFSEIKICSVSYSITPTDSSFLCKVKYSTLS